MPTPRSLPLMTVRVGGLVAAGLGMLALLGWALQSPLLAGLRANPMAPSTALLLILYGVAAWLRARSPGGRAAHRAGAIVHWLGVLVALLLLTLSSRGILSDAELLGFSAAGMAGEGPVGHMSPVVAVWFILASLSFLESRPSSVNRPWRAEAAWWSAGLVLAASFVLLVAYLFGNPLFYAGSVIPPAATTSIAFAALGTALLALAMRQAAAEGTARFTGRIPYSLVLVFVLLAAGIVTVGGLYLRFEARRYRAAIERQLSAVAELKTAELVRWREQRVADANVLLDNTAFSSLVRRMFALPPDAEAREQLRDWLDDVQVNYLYDRITLFDAGGGERLTVPQRRAAGSPMSMLRVPEVLRSGRVTFDDFYSDENDGRVYLSVLVPILDGRGQALGVLLFRIDPESHLYPSINRWPAPAQTAETLLVRRDGNDALILNDLKLRKHTALALRVPLVNEDVAVVKAVLGQEGIVEARDYRGAPVIAATRKVPDSPWFLVARMDTSEVYAPLRERVWVTVALVGSMLAAAAAGVGVVWREQRVRELRGRYEAEQERIAERRRMEEQLRGSNAELEQRVHERTRALEWTNKELEAFSYSVSHDLRTPLRAIDGFSQVLLEDHSDQLDAQGRHHLERIRAAAQRMGGLIDELLTLSRITHVELQRQAVDISALAEKVAEELRRWEPDRIVSLAIAPGLVAQADASLLRIALDNLIGNAWKFTRDTPAARISFDASRIGGAVVYCVRDNGAGFDMAYADKLFKAFQRLHSASEFEGSGIGLAIVARVIHRHGGEIRAEAVVGKGAAVFFTLAPAGVEPAQAEAIG